MISFAYDSGWLVEMDSVEQPCEQLTRAEIKVVEWWERSNIIFDNSKEEMTVFTRQRKTHMRQRLQMPQSQSAATS